MSRQPSEAQEARPFQVRASSSAARAAATSCAAGAGPRAPAPRGPRPSPRRARSRPGRCSPVRAADLAPPAAAAAAASALPDAWPSSRGPAGHGEPAAGLGEGDVGDAVALRDVAHRLGPDLLVEHVAVVAGELRLGHAPEYRRGRRPPSCSVPVVWLSRWPGWTNVVSRTHSAPSPFPSPASISKRVEDDLIVPAVTSGDIALTARGESLTSAHSRYRNDCTARAVRRRGLLEVVFGRPRRRARGSVSLVERSASRIQPVKTRAARRSCSANDIAFVDSTCSGSSTGTDLFCYVCRAPAASGSRSSRGCRQSPQPISAGRRGSVWGRSRGVPSGAAHNIPRRP